jgi:hypothetical protein
MLLGPHRLHGPMRLCLPACLLPLDWMFASCRSIRNEGHQAQYVPGRSTS